MWLALGLSILLLVLPVASVLTWRETKVTAGDGFPIRIMTYNLHNGFNTDGYLDMETLAKVIEKNHPDIIALQEISRGWVISGRLDMLTWLSQRLDMSCVSGPTADPLWGNAILSRFPIIEFNNYELPPRDLFILRGFTSVVIDIGGGDSLQVIATHFHHLEKDSNIRQLQSPVIKQIALLFWGTLMLSRMLLRQKCCIKLVLWMSWQKQSLRRPILSIQLISISVLIIFGCRQIW